MNRRVLSLVALIIVWSLPLQSQQVVVGEVAAGNAGFYSLTGTVINTVNPANADGQLTMALVRFVLLSPSCSGGTFKLRFYRPAGSTLTETASRGPFPIDTRTKTLTLTPPVEVRKGDLMGIAQQTDGRCGVSSATGGPADLYLTKAGDFSGGAMTDLEIVRNFRYAFRASSEKRVLAGIVPAVGSLAGGFGSQFRTSFQVVNPDDEEMIPSLLFTFHPRGTTGTAADPSTFLDALTNATNSVDLLARMNATGLGSLDVFTPLWAPVMVVRVYNDSGNATNGFFEPMIPVSQALHRGEHGRLIFPADLNNYRMNVGIRTLDNGVTLVCNQYSETGTFIGQFQAVYGPNFFDQVSLQSFAANPIVPGGSIDIQTFSGDVIIYTTTTDNRTNDSAISILARP